MHEIGKIYRLADGTRVYLGKGKQHPVSDARPAFREIFEKANEIILIYRVKDGRYIGIYDEKTKLLPE